MFTVNGIQWFIQFVEPYSDYLRRTNGSYTLGVTDGNTKTIYLSDNLYGQKLMDVISHEITHCFMMSYGIYMSIEDEELTCEIISKYGRDIIHLSDEIYNRIIN